VRVDLVGTPLVDQEWRGSDADDRKGECISQPIPLSNLVLICSVAPCRTCTRSESKWKNPARRKWATLSLPCGLRCESRSLAFDVEREEVVDGELICL